MYSLKNNSLSGPDEISLRFLVLAARVLITPLQILFSFSFQSGIFSVYLKSAKVIPFYNQRDKTNTGNF